MSKRYTILIIIAISLIMGLLLIFGSRRQPTMAGAAQVQASLSQQRLAQSTIVAGTPFPALARSSQRFGAGSSYPTPDGGMHVLAVSAWPTAEAMRVLGYTPRGAYGLEGQSVALAVMAAAPTPAAPMPTDTLSGGSVMVQAEAAADYRPPPAPSPPPVAPISTSGVRGKAAIGDYRLLGTPSISGATIEQVLQQYSSPAIGNGQAFYDLGVKYGIDPAFMLAFYVHESGAGTQGAAVATKSVGNIICPGWAGACIGRFRAYDNYVQAAEDWYQLITSNLYIGDGLDTPAKITPRYAPDSDNNDSNGYAQTVMRLVDEWRGWAQ